MFLFIKLFSVVCIFLLICYVVGAAIIQIPRSTPRERFFALFINLVLGLTTIVSVYALICTRGNTVQFAILAIMLYISWDIRKNIITVPLLSAKPVILSRNGRIALPILFILSAAIFCSQYFILYDSSSSYLQTPFVDYVYYSRLSLPLNKIGLETNSLEAIYPQFLTQQPYHYFEIWLNALLVHFTALPSVWVFFISSSSILLTIICVGFVAIFAHFQLRTIWALVFAILLLSVTGVRWPFLQHNSFVANGALISSTILCLHPKFAPIYVFTLLAGLLLLNRYYTAAGAALAILPLVFISTAPIVGIVVVFIAIYLFLVKQLSFVKALITVLPIILSISYLVLFYILHPEPYQFPGTGRSFALQSIIPRISEAKTLLNITLGVFINYLIYFAAYLFLLLLLMLIKRESNLLNRIPTVIWVWFSISLILAAMMRAFGTHYLDSFQFFSNTMMPLTPVVFSIVLAVLLQRASASLHFLAASFILTLVTVNFLVVGTGTTRYSSEFMQKISKVMSQTGFRGAYILADSDYRNPYMLSSDSYTVGNYISSFKNDYAFVSLSELDVDSLNTDVRFKRDSAQAEQIIRKSSIYRFAKFKSLNKKKLSLDSIKYKFITDNNISFICASSQAKLPRVLQPLVSLMYTDTLSGERFYLLKPKKGTFASSAYN